MTFFEALNLSAAVVLLLASPMTGSFLKCWADRAAAGQSVADGRSYCDNCGRTLAARDLIPILSWIFAGGKARCCGATLRWTLLTPEITSTALAIWAWFAAPPGLLLTTLVLAWLLQAIALLSVPAPRIATVLTMLLAVLGMALSYAGALVGLESHLLGFALGLLISTVAWTGATDPNARFLRGTAILPAMGALLGVAGMGLAIGIGVFAAIAHHGLAKVMHQRAPDAQAPSTSLAIGWAFGTWIVWLYGRDIFRWLVGV